MREDQESRVKERKNQEIVWPEWLGSVGIRSWMKGNEAEVLERF